MHSALSNNELAIVVQRRVMLLLRRANADVRAFLKCINAACFGNCHCKQVMDDGMKKRKKKLINGNEV